MPTARVYLSLIALYLIWGSTFGAIKIGLEHYPPFFMAGLRYTISGLVFMVIAYNKKPRRLQWAEILRAASIGFLLTFSNALVCWAELGLDSGIAALIITSVPIFLVGLNALSFEKKVPSYISLIGLAVSISGLLVIFYPAFFISGLHKQLPFMALLVFSSLTWAVGSLLQKTSNKENPVPFFQNLAIQVASGGVSLLFISMSIGEKIPNIFAIGIAPTAAVMYLAIFGTVIAYTCYIFCLRHASAVLVSTYALVNPVIAILLGVVFLGETFSLRLAYASLLVLTGVGVVIFEPKIKSISKKLSPFKKTRMENKEAC